MKPSLKPTKEKLRKRMILRKSPKVMTRFDSESRMPFGVYRDKQLKEIPASYFIYILKADYRFDEGLRAYIDQNMKRFEKEVKDEEKPWR